VEGKHAETEYILREMHYDTLKSQSNIAVTLHKLGTIQEAENEWTAGDAKDAFPHGNRPTQTLRARENLAVMYRTTGNVLKRMYREGSIENDRKNPGKAHPGHDGVDPFTLHKSIGRGVFSRGTEEIAID